MELLGVRHGSLLLFVMAVHLTIVGAGPLDWASKIAKALRGQSVKGEEGQHVVHNHQRALLSSHSTHYSSIEPVQGSVLGWDTVTIRGMGFQHNVSYELTFTDSLNQNLSASLYQWLGDNTLTFLTPVWSGSFASAQTQVTLSAQGLPIALDNTSSTLLYSFNPQWYPESFTPTIGLAEGGTRVMLSGVGFNEADFYSCRFSYFENGWLLHQQEVAAINVSGTDVECETPLWAYSAKSVAVSLWRVPAAVEGSFNASLFGTGRAEQVQEEVHSQGSVSYFKYLEVWRAMSPLQSGAAGGHAVTVLGIGWDSAEVEVFAMPFGAPEVAMQRAYKMVFDAGNVSAEGDCVVQSDLVLVCTTPPWPASASTANVTVVVRYTVEEGFFLRTKTRLVAAVNGSAASEAFRFVEEWAAITPRWGDKLGGTRVTVSGNGFSGVVVYQCNFSAVAEAREEVVAAVVLSPSEVLCDATPLWSDAQGLAFSAASTSFSLLADGVPVVTFGDRSFDFVFINKAPAFSARNLIVEGTARNYSEAWLLSSSPGLYNNGTEAVDETSQNTSFVVRGLPEQLFDVPPSVVGDRLTFTIADTYIGVATVRVYLVDDGGTAYGGSNQSAVQDYSITVLQYPRPPSFEMFDNVTVLEHTWINSGFYEMVGFISNIMDPPNDLLQQVRLDLSYPFSNSSRSLFAIEPAVFLNGSLVFALAPWEYGEVRVSVRLLAEAAASIANFSLIVLPVNQAPSFVLSPAAVANLSMLHEGSGEYAAADLAINISRGPPVDNEDHQRLTFHTVLVEGSSALFVPFSRSHGNCTPLTAMDAACAGSFNSSLVLVDANGSVGFTLAPFQHGSAMFEMTLLDDGTVANGGADASPPQRFNVTVLPVNSPPTFAIRDVVLWEGAGNVSWPEVAVNISTGSPTGDEDWQRLSFMVWSPSNCTSDMSLFESDVTIDANGTLHLSLKAYAAGEVSLMVVLVDDGGTDRGGMNMSSVDNFTISVLPVNQPPSFSIRTELQFVETDPDYYESGFATNISRGSPTGNEEAQNVTFSVELVNITGWISGGPALLLTADGDLSIQFAPFEYGIAVFDIFLTDDGGTVRGGANVSQKHTLTIVTLPVNNPPSFDLEPLVRAVEGDGSTVVPGVATNISRGSPIGNEDHQNLTFTWRLRNGSLSLFSAAGVRLSPAGNLSFVLAPYEFGTVVLDFTLLDDGGTANGGINQSEPQSLTVHVDPRNNAPSFDIPPYVRVLVGTNYSSGRSNDSAPLVANISRGSPIGNEDHQMLTFSVVRTNGSSSLLTVPLSIAPDGLLTFVANEYDYGWLHFNVSLADDGGTEYDGRNVSETKPFAVHVVYVNHAPSFLIAEPHVVAWEGLDVSVPGFASNISKGSPTGSEDWQTLSFRVRIVDTSAPMLDPLNVTISPQGDLFFTLEEFENGFATLEVILVDDGGTERGGENASAVASFNVTVLPVNNAPEFVLASPVVVLEGSGLVARNGVAYDISRGAPNGNEDAQNLTFSVSFQNGSHELFTSPNVTMDDQGTLFFDLAPFQYGAATFLVTLVDSGGTERDGSNASAAQLLTVTVIPVNDPPTFNASGFSVLEDEGLIVVPGLASSIRAGPPPPIDNEDAQQLEFELTFVSGSIHLFRPFSFSNSPFDCVNASSVGANLSVGANASGTNATLTNVTCGAGFVQSLAEFWPRIASRVRLFANGTMAFTLADDEYGSAKLGLLLKDDGGVSNGGLDRSSVIEIAISVLPVNDPPSFLLGSGDCLGGIIPFGCSASVTTIIIRRNAFLVGERYSLDAFASDIFPGPHNEADQAVSFEVLQAGGAALLVNLPAVSAGGALSLTQLADTVGEAQFWVRAVDSGGVERGGVNSSAYQAFRLVVVSGVVEATVVLRVNETDFDVIEFVQDVSDTISVPVERIAITSVQSVVVSASRRLMQLGGVQVAVQVYLLTDDPAVLQNVALLLGNLTVLTDVQSVNATLAPVDESGTATFDLINPQISVYEDQGAHAIPALTNIFSVNSQLDINGNQIVFFAVVQLNGTNETILFSNPPHVNPATCTFNETCGTTISFSTRPTENGEAWFLIRQLGSTVVRTLHIVVLPINQAPTFALSQVLVVLDEDTASLTIPEFAANISRGPPDEAPQSLSFQVVPVASTGPLFFDGTSMPGGYNLSQWLVQTVTIDPADGTLHVGLVPFAIGNVTFEVTLVDDGGVVVTNSSVLGDDSSVPVNFTVRSLPVNHEPSFSLPNLALQVAEDCGPIVGGSCSGPAYTLPEFAQDVLNGPPNEDVQLRTFSVVPVDCQVPRFSAGAWRNASDIYSAGCPPDLTFPGMSLRSERLFSAPVQVSPNGTLTFSLASNRHGIVRFEISLRDDGGLVRGGDDVSPTVTFSIEILRVNDPPSFTLSATSISVNQDCMGYSPSAPYPNGWTWTTDAVLCALEQGQGNFRDGCWVPLWTCTYSPVLAAGGTRRLLSAHNASVPECNSTVVLFPTCECDQTPNCSCSCDNITFWAEMLLVDYNRSQLLSSQNGLKIAIAAAFDPLLVSPEDVRLRSVFNFSEIPFQKEATRTLLQTGQSYGVSVLFSVALFFDPDQATFLSAVPEQMRTNLVSAGVPEVAVVGWEVVASGVGVEAVAAFCTPPEPPPRVQCQDGAYILDDLVQNVKAGGWGEQLEDIWFVVERISGPEIGAVDVRFPVRNVSRNAIFEFVPLDGRFGASQYNITIYDSGGTANGGIDNAVGAVPLTVTVVGQNLPPSFELAADVLLYTQDSACVETLSGGCDGLCTGGVSLCVGGRDEGNVCDDATPCAGNCTGGAYIPVTISCLGTCSCPVVTADGQQVVVPSCDTLGLCSCQAPNTNAICFNSSECTGGGACSDIGVCTPPADDGGNCTLDAQCSNEAVCTPKSERYFRHLHRNRAVSITAGSENEDGGASCPPGTTVGNGCALQTVTFSVVPRNLTSANEVFSELPALSADGALTFNLTQGAFGAVEFDVTLQDDSGDPTSDTSPSQLLVIAVSPVNAQPSFDLPASITVLEDSGRYENQVAFNIISPNSIGIATVIVFEVDSSNPTLFSELPQMDADGVLTFNPAADAFGQSLCEVTLRDLSRPTAGDARVAKPLTLTVQPVNDQPTMTLINTDAFFSVPINAGVITAPLFANIQPGPPNEACDDNSAGCESQSVSFIVVGIANPLLFLWVPSIDSSTGEITFRVKPDATGSSSVTLGVIDDGFELTSQLGCVPANSTSFMGVYGNGADAPCLVDAAFDQAGLPSLLTTFGVQVVPEGNRNDLKVLYEVNCTGVLTEEACSCPSLTESTVDENLVPIVHPVCSLLSGAVADDYLPTRAELVIEGDQGAREVENFAEVIREDDYLEASLALFSVTVDPTSTVKNPSLELEFIERRQDAEWKSPGLEYATDIVYSPDGLFAYAAEPETDSFSSWKRDPGAAPEVPTGGGEPLQFMFRRAYGEQRLRFGGLKDAPAFGDPPMPVLTPGLCGLQSFEVGGIDLVAQAAGCEDPALDMDTRPNSTWQGGPAEGLVGFWDMTSTSLYGNHSPGQFDEFGSLDWTMTPAGTVGNPATLTTCVGRWCLAAYEATGSIGCRPGYGCSYSRPAMSLPNCREPGLGLTIFPATIENQAVAANPDIEPEDMLPAALFTGPKCRSAPRSLDWMAAPTPMSPVNFLVNNGRYEAMQFDGALNPGLFLTNDIRTLVDRDPVKSKLPREHMSVEAWVTVDAQEYLTSLDSEYTGAIMAAASGRTVSESGNVAGTCNKGWMLSSGVFALSAAGGGLSFRFQISLEKNAGTNGAGAFEVAEGDADLPPGCSCPELGISGSCSCFSGRWHHVVATYDGAFLEVHVNGVLKRRKRACADAPCGGIVYPADYHPTDGSPTSACTDNGPVPVTIGNYSDRNTGETQPHRGLIKHVALFKRALGAEEILDRFNHHRDLYMSPVHWQRYWGKVPGISPSIDFFDASSLGGKGKATISVKGVFRSDLDYRCAFLVDDRTNVSTPAVLAPPARTLTFGGVAADNGLGMFADRDTLTCLTPEWQFGARSVELVIVEDGAPMWQKLCTAAECGYTSMIERVSVPTTHVWSYLTPSPADYKVLVPCPLDSPTCARAVLASSAHGTKTQFRFMTGTGLWAWDTGTWTGGAPVKRVVVTHGGAGHTNGIIRHSRPAGWPDYDVYELSWAAVATGGQIDLGPAAPNSNIGGGFFRPGFNSITWFAAFGPGCAEVDADCVETPQLGRVTEMYAHNTLNVTGCDRPGIIYGLDDGMSGGFGLVAKYDVANGYITNITFETPRDRGENYTSVPALNLTDQSCTCFGGYDWSQCITVVVNVDPITVSVEAELGFQHISDFDTASQGVFGKSDCTTVAGCVQDPAANAVLGVSEIDTFVDDSTGLTVAVAANYHDWAKKEVNSTVFVIEPVHMQPVVVQQVETAAAVDVKSFEVLGSPPMRVVAFANFHGPAMLYKWTGGAEVAAAHIVDAGRNYVNGTVAIESQFGSGFTGAFEAFGGAVRSVQVAAAGSGYFPEASGDFYFGAGCAVDDSACQSVRMTGSVVSISVVNATWLENCSHGQVIVDSLGIGNGLAAHLSWGGSGDLSVVFPDAYSHGSDFTPFDVRLVAQFTPLASDPNATSTCTCRGSLELNECLTPHVAFGGQLALLPLHTAAVPISEVQLVSAGAGYVPGRVSAVGMTGSSFSMSFSADASVGSVSSLRLHRPGDGYFPDTEVDLFYAPLCAFNDERCTTTPMTGSVTKVVISDPSGISGCDGEGTILLSGGGGEGFEARFEALTRTGQIGRIYFVHPEDHGRGYDAAVPWAVELGGNSSCRCHGTANFSQCLYPWIATGAQLLPQPQAQLRAQYCPSGQCSDLGRRSFRHPWHPETASRASVPMDLTRPFAVDTTGAVALEAFDMNGSTYLAVACHYDAARDSKETPSKLFRLSVLTSAAASLVMTEVAALNTVAARDVVHFEDVGSPGKHWLLFTQDGGESLLFSSYGGPFELAQRVPLRGGGSLLSFAEGLQRYVLAAERDADSSSLLRFNGSHLLGVQDTAVLPKDSAGGQLLPSARATAFARWERDGVSYMLLGNGLNCSFAGLVAPSTCSRNVVFSSLFRQHIEDPIPLAGAKSVVVSRDGRSLYVVGYSSNALAAFDREPATGELYFNPDASYIAGPTVPYYQLGGDQPQEGGDFPALQGGSAVVVSPDDRFVYATAASEGAVYVFARNSSSGRLSLIQNVRDGDFDGARVIDSLAGAASVAVTNRSLYVAAQVDQAVSVFDRNEDGTLAFVDRIRAGERMLTRFERPVDESANASWSASSAPRRLHASHATTGNGSMPGWLEAARKTVNFVIDGVPYLAVAAGRDTPGGGTVAVYKWDAREEAFAFVQDTGNRDPSPADIAYLVEDSGSLVRGFLVVANTEGETHVYLWRNGAFLLYQTVPITHPKNGGQIPPYTLNSGLQRCPRTGATTTSSTAAPTTSAFTTSTAASNVTFVETPAGLTYNSEFLTVPRYTCIPTAMAQRIEAFKIDGTSYLGIAYVWDQPVSQPYKWYSLIYRWNHLGFAVLEDGSQEEGFGFDMYQILPTNGATDMEFVSVPSWALGPLDLGPLNLLVVANLLHESIPGSFESEAVVWRHSRSAWNPLLREPAGAFELLQTIPTTGAYDLHTFTVPFQPAPAGQLLLLGIASRQSGEADYTPASALWAFVDSSTGFAEWQTLDDVYGMTGISSLREGDEVHLIISVSCNTSCQDFALDGNTTRRRSLLAGGPTPVTSSTILQWDQRTGKFDNLMALTDTDHLAKFGYPVPDDERRVHSGAVLLNIPNAAHAVPVQVGSVTLLVLSSESEGVVLMEWDFPRVPGLEGVNLVVPDPLDSSFLALGDVARALVRVRRSPQVDSRNRTVSLLMWDETISEEPIAVDRLQSSHAELVQGLAGGQRMELYPAGCTLVADFGCPAGTGNVTGSCPVPAPPCDFLLVHSGPPRHALPCSSAPPISAVPPHLLVSTHIPARCSEPEIVVQVTQTDNADMFAFGPAIVDGNLVLEAQDGQFGRSHFVAYVNGSSFSYEFAITVTPIRYRPTFEPLDVVVLEDAGISVVQFAQNLQSGRAGATPEHLLNMYFELNLPAGGQCDYLIPQPSTLWIGTVYVANGEGYGAVRFEWEADRWGLCEVSARLVDPEELDPVAKYSQRQWFTIRALPVNDAPVFTLQFAPNFPDLEQGSPRAVVSEFIYNSGLSGGDPLGFSLGPYEDFCESPRVRHRATPCLCRDGGYLFNQSYPCEYNFTLWRVEKRVANNQYVKDEAVLFDEFRIDYTGSLHYTLNPGRFGTFNITIRMTDDGGTARGGVDQAFRSFFLTVLQKIVPPSVEGYTEQEYAPLRLPYPLPLPAEEHDFLDDFSQVRLANLTAINLTVPEMHFAVPQVYDDFLTHFVNGPPDQEAANSLNLTIVNISNTFLFAKNNESECTGCPRFNVGGRMGTLAFELAPFMFGVSTMEIQLISRGGPRIETSNFQIDMVVLPVNNPPSAMLPEFLGIVEGSGLMEIAMFATNISVGPENEQWQEAQFAVQTEVDTPLLLQGSPEVSFNGTLRLNLSDARHGQGVLTVMLTDTGGAFVGGQDAAAGFPKKLPLKVFPLPRVVTVSPCVGPVHGGWTVTVYGQYFGSQYSRNTPWGTNVSTYDDVEVRIDGGRCERQVLVSDTQLLCDMPAGRGRKTLEVFVPGGVSLNANGDLLSHWNRTGVYAPGVVQADIYYAGGATGVTDTDQAGLVAFGPDMTAVPQGSCGAGNLSLGDNATNSNSSSASQTCPAASVGRDPASLSVVPGVGLTRSVRAITPFQDRLVLGGSFLGRGGAARHLSYLVSWDGSKLGSLAGGVDGTVYSLNRWEGMLVVGGAFSLLYGGQSLEQETLKSGGLGLWDGAAWSMAGGAVVHGAVTCTHVQGSALFVAGRFRKIGNTTASNIARLEHGRWSALGEGLRARDVLAMAGSEGDLFVAGDISIAGAVQVGNLARWLVAEEEWRPMKELNGVVRALALVGNRLFVGGDFSLAGILPAGAIAQTDIAGGGEVSWQEVGGVGGSVHSMLYNRGCLYVGGRFDSVAGREGVLAARNVARWCIEGASELGETWEPVRGMEGAGGLVLAMAAAD